MFPNDMEIPVSKHPYIRSATACLRSSELAVHLAKTTGARLHILHISTAKELNYFRLRHLTKSESPPKLV